MTRSRQRKLGRGRTQQCARQVLKIAPLASAILAVIHPAQAQEQQPQQTTVLGEIMVTSQKREESLQDVPLSVTAIGNQQITQLHLSDFNDYVQFLPSVSFQTTGPGFGLAYFRGVA